MTDALLRFVHISDTHISHDPDYNSKWAPVKPADGARELVRRVNALDFPIDFILHTGDVAYNPIPEAYPLTAEILGSLRWPVIYLAGNHDDSAMLQRVVMGRPPERVQEQLHGLHEINGIQLACVDSNGDAEDPAGHITGSQLAFLEAVCTADDDRPLIIAVHHNILKTGVPWLDDYMGTVNGEAFHEIVKQARDRVRGVFFGHVHQTIETVRDGVLYSSVASPWYALAADPGQTHSTPDPDGSAGFSVVTLTETDTFIRRYNYPFTGHSTGVSS